MNENSDQIHDETGSVELTDAPSESHHGGGCGWREIYGANHVAIPAGVAETDTVGVQEAQNPMAARTLNAPLPDGGRYLLPNSGAHVRDRDTDDEHDTLIVVAVHAETAAEDYEIDELDGATVADVNGDYDPGAPVVEAVYVDEAEEQLDGWRSVEDLRDAVSFGTITAYSFPVSRLARDHRGAKTETGARSSQGEGQPGRDGASGRVDG